MQINNNWKNQLFHAIEAAKLASKFIVEFYNSDFEVETKADESPVTIADKTADKIISDFLKSHYPEYGFLTEESTDDLSRLEKDLVWIVDPIDGTQEFITKNNEFNTNIALSYKGDIVVGVIYIPLTGEYYFAVKDSGAYYFNGIETVQIHVSNKTRDLTCLTSRCHANEKEEKVISDNKHIIGKCVKVGAALKACLIARGDAEIAYRICSNTKEWDTAPMQILLEEAGGVFVTNKKEIIKYNKRDVYNHDGYICANLLENIRI